MLWQHGSTELTSFIEHLNTCHPTFKFTCDQSPTKVNFLDNTVCKTQQGTLYTTLYTKQRKLCRYCQKLDLSGRIISPVSHRAYRTRTNASCQSQNLIYALQCTSCNKIYVGQTKRQLTKRLCEHFKTIKTENDQKNLGIHFSQINNHHGHEDAKIYVLDFCQKAPTDENKPHREKLGKTWQFRLHSHFPYGLNTEDESLGYGGN